MHASASLLKNKSWLVHQIDYRRNPMRQTLQTDQLSLSSVSKPIGNQAGDFSVCGAAFLPCCFLPAFLPCCFLFANGHEIRTLINIKAVLSWLDRSVWVCIRSTIKEMLCARACKPACCVNILILAGYQQAYQLPSANLPIESHRRELGDCA